MKVAHSASSNSTVMVASYILKRLALAFGLAIAITIIYHAFQESTGNEGKQLSFLLCLTSLAICFVSGLLSLLAFLNTKSVISSRPAYSFLAFCGGPCLSFLALLLMFGFHKRPSDTLNDFLVLSIGSLTHCLALVLLFIFQAQSEKKH